MRTFFTASAALLLTFTMTACPGKKDDSEPNEVATTPLQETPITNTCLTGQQNCNMNGYQTYQPYGFRPYPINPYYYGGYGTYWTQYSGFNVQIYSSVMFCDCPIGTIPVYNNQYGLGCVSRTVVTPFIGVIGYYNLPSANGHWVNTPQVSSVAGPTARYDLNAANRARRRRPMPAHNCHAQVAQSCFTAQPNSCMGGQICRPTAPNSGLGICSYQ